MIHLCIGIKSSYHSYRKLILPIILIEHVILTKFEGLKFCLNEVFSSVRVDKPLSATFPIMIYLLTAIG